MTQSDAIVDVLNSENFDPDPMIKTVCADIAGRHTGRVIAFIYYGSSLRAINDPEKMLDFYVIIDSYRKTHRNPLRVLANVLIPPSVYYHEMLHANGTLSRCKYSMMSIKAFERRCGPTAFLSTTWGRFAQPCLVLFSKDNAAHNRVQTARANAVKHMAAQTRPLLSGDVSFVQFWARGLRESYRTELRPEKAEDRSVEIINRYADRYKKLSNILVGDVGDDKFMTLINLGSYARLWSQTKWALRRIIGKPVGAIRVINSAFTFDGGIDYVMRKLEDHSGVRISLSDHQRRHPVLWSPVLAWKYYRRGAFR